MQKNAPNKSRHTIKTICSEIECEVVYPDENPKNALQDICTGLAAVGLFDDVKQK